MNRCRPLLLVKLMLLGMVTAAPAQQAADTAQTVPVDAFLDADAEALLANVRRRLLTIDQSVAAYSTNATERITVSVRTPLRDRVLYGREVAAEVDWVRDGPVTVAVQGARQTLPTVTGGEGVPDDLGSSAGGLAFEPSTTLLLGNLGGDSDFRDPLRAGSERWYRYRSGTSQTIRLPDGSEVRLLELQVLPRRRDPDLVRGTYLIDQRTWSIVQGTFRLAGDWELGEEEEDARVVTRWIGPVRARIDYLTVTYGLWDLQWWMPQLVALHGEAEIGGFASVPLLFERRYGAYRITATPVPEMQVTAEQRDSIRNGVRCPSRYRVVIRVGDQEPTDTLDVNEEDGEDLSPEQQRECDRLRVQVPADSLLVASAELSGIPFGSDATLMTEEEMRRIAERLGELSTLGAPFSAVRLTTPREDLTLARYNRVEGLSLGLRAESDTRWGAVSVTGRFGLADQEPLAELRFAPDPVRFPVQVAAYRRLVAMDSTARPSSLGTSLSAALLGRDDADYFRTLGIEVGSTGSPLGSSGFRWRLYAQKETAAEKNTDFAVAEWFGRTNVFPENRPADDATQFGGAVGYSTVWTGSDVWRWGAEGWLDGAGGSRQYVRPSATLRAVAPLPGRLVLGVEAGGGAAWGDPALQHQFWLGGAGSLRGYPTGYLFGESFWRSRAEIGTEFPAFRLSLFSDVGWAGERDRLGDGPQAISTGVGIGLLDGLLRLDVAKRLRGESGWRLTGSLDSWL